MNWEKVNEFLGGGLPALLDWPGYDLDPYRDPYPERYPPDMTVPAPAYDVPLLESDAAPWMIGGAVLVGVALLVMLVRK